MRQTIRLVPALLTLLACSAATPPESPEPTDEVASGIAGGMQLVVGPAEVWIGVAHAADEELRVDVLAEALLDDVVVARGETDDVAASRGGGDPTAFAGAILRIIGLVTPKTAVTDGANLGLRLSVRRTCSSRPHLPDAGTTRIWFNGAARDSGPNRDAASRFSTRVDGVKTKRYLRGEGSLAVPVVGATAGNARTFVDTPVDSSEACRARSQGPEVPDRAFTEVTTWAEIPSFFTCKGNLQRVVRDPATGMSLDPLQLEPFEERFDRATATYFNFNGVHLNANLLFPRYGVSTSGAGTTLLPTGPKVCDALGKCTQAYAIELQRMGLQGLVPQDFPCRDTTTAGQFAMRICTPASTTTVHLSGVLTTRPGPLPYVFTFDQDYQTAGYYGGVTGFSLTDQTRYLVQCNGKTILVPHSP